MIKGIGIDIVKISRIEALLVKYGDSFTSKVFTQTEIEYCSVKAFPAIHFAGRWAAKEAFYKALPRPCQEVSGWKSIAIGADQEVAGKPSIFVCAPALRDALRACGIAGIHLSLSHEKEMCVAAVILD